MDEKLIDLKYSAPHSERLDHFLVNQLPEFTRTRLQGIIKKELVTVDGEIVTKTGFKLDAGMSVAVRIPPPQPIALVPESIPLNIIFENDDVIVVNKPAGMVVHPSAGHHSGTLVHAALAHAPEMEGIGGEIRPGIVHRLDKDTSGLILLAKNDRALLWLQKQFKSRAVQKIYLALVDGAPPTPKGRIEAPIGRDPAHRKKMAIVSATKGRNAISEYRTLENFEKHTLLEVNIHTGRTHQIRLHCAFIETPIAGDRLYGHRKQHVEISRQFLHAARLTFTLPNEEKPRTFEAPLPEELESVLAELRR
ncbi:MAG: RluA family pseudouridine synthase [Anaerolineae bacterium]|jgi:23S rRNA pseudouridine1911/1915/1917 synthase|nr:RluA family pseudouridine synthase [Anaerolineae bacterium]MBT7073236.1 RluA family pseudouridine synthase [Anaerolineae bacterium]MBT7325348.1 RluA family pseudouridine synthase [Anaerolineae bacterium]